MPARKILSDYIEEFGITGKGVDRRAFDEANADDYLDLVCKCKNKFESRRRDLIQRFRRGNDVSCSSCVNTINRTLEEE